jgi:hypothetical protein
MVQRCGENRGRVGKERGSKEMDGCPLTQPHATIHENKTFNYHLSQVRPLFPVAGLELTHQYV